MASDPFGAANDIGNHAITLYKPGPPKGQARSLRLFTESVREKLSNKPIVDFRTDGRFQEVMKSCTDLKEVHVGVNEEVKRLSEMLKKMKLANDKTIKSIDARVTFLSGTSHLIMQEGNKNWELLAKLEATADFTSGASFIDEIDDNCDNIQSNTEAVQNALQQCEERTALVVQDFIKAKLWLKNIERVIERGIDEDTPLEITMDDFRLFCGSLKEHVEGNIFVVKESEGKRRAAPVKVLSENQILLSGLEEMDLPPKSFFIKFESLTYTSRRAFLDLAFEETFLSRIVVSLQEEGNLPDYFFHMCTGDLGPAYASYGEFEVSSSGNVIIRQGSQDVKKMVDLSVYKGIDWEKEMKRDVYKYKLCKGDVLCLGLDKTGSLFQVYNRKAGGNTVGNNYPCFGSVVEGLGDLRDGLSKYPNLEVGDVTDCGLLINF